MKNQLLTPVLLPTKDATNIFFIDVFGKELGYNEKLIPNGNKNQHIYLCSDAPTKEGYCLSPDNTVCKVIGYDTDINKYYVFIRGAKCFIEKDYKKIEFASDPKLTKCDGKCAKNECVCTLVPTIDGNTKALVFKQTLSKKVGKVVNFLEELCKRWNEKNNQKVDVEKWFKNMGVSNPDKNFRAGFKDGYNQALQSNTGFSLEDMRKCWNEAGDWFEEKAPARSFYAFIQSLTKETPKGEIVIELNEGKLIFW